MWPQGENIKKWKRWKFINFDFHRGKNFLRRRE